MKPTYSLTSSNLKADTESGQRETEKKQKKVFKNFNFITLLYYLTHARDAVKDTSTTVKHVRPALLHKSSFHAYLKTKNKKKKQKNI